MHSGVLTRRGCQLAAIGHKHRFFSFSHRRANSSFATRTRCESSPTCEQTTQPLCTAGTECLAAETFTIYAPPRQLDGHALVEVQKPELMTWPATFSIGDADAACRALGGRLAPHGPAVEALLRYHLPFIQAAYGADPDEVPVSEGLNEKSVSVDRTKDVFDYVNSGTFSPAPPCPLVAFSGRAFSRAAQITIDFRGTSCPTASDNGIPLHVYYGEPVCTEED